MSLAGLSLRDLEYVIAVAEMRHFGRAAEACGVSQSALSMQIKKIESLLSIRIFERTNKRVLLTPKGEVMVRQAGVIVAEARRLLDLAKRWDEPLSGWFRLGAIATLGPYLFPHVLRFLRRSFPKLELVLKEARTRELLADLLGGRLDAALVSPPIDEPDVMLEPIFFEPFILIASQSHPLAAAKAVTADALPRDGVVLLEEGHCLRDQTLSVCAGAEQRPGTLQATSLETLKHMVALGSGFSLLPALAAQDARAFRGLVRLSRFAGRPPGRIIGLAWRASVAQDRDHRMLADALRVAAPPVVEPIAAKTKPGSIRPTKEPRASGRNSRNSSA